MPFKRIVTWNLVFSFLQGYFLNCYSESVTQKSECLVYSTPIGQRTAVTHDLEIETRNSTAKSSDLANRFASLHFRANNYGTAKYKLELETGQRFRLRIQLFENGQRPDTLKGGDLNGIYAFEKTVLDFGLESTGKGRTVDVWHIYVLKNESRIQENESSAEVVALQVTFQESETWNPRLNPIFAVLRKLASNHTSVNLPHNFDLYDLMPLETGFAIYETNAFPFVYPRQLKPQDGSNNCGPIVKTYLFTHPLKISSEQLEYLAKSGQKLGKGILPIVQTKDVQNAIRSNEIQNFGKVVYVPLKEHLLFRRMVMEAHSLEGEELEDPEDDEYYDEDYTEPVTEGIPASTESALKPIVPQDEELYPPDCTILYQAIEEFQNMAAHGEETSAGSKFTSYSLFILFMARVVGYFN